MTVSDQELLGALRDALVTDDASAPSPAEMARFHEAVARGRAGTGSGAIARARLAWDAWRALPPRLSPALVGAAAAVAVLGVFGGAVAANTLPGPLRSAAYDVGLPVSSPALVAAEGAETALQGALSSKDRSAIASDVSVLRARLSVLDASDRATAGPEAQRLLSEADVLLAHDTNAAPTSGSTPSTSTGGSTGGGTTATPSTTGVVIAPPPDDSGGSGSITEPAQTTEPTDTTEPAQTTEPVQTTEPSATPESSGTSSDSSSTTTSSGSTDTTSSSTSSSSSSGDATSTSSGTSTTPSGSSSSTDN